MILASLGKQVQYIPAKQTILVCETDSQPIKAAGCTDSAEELLTVFQLFKIVCILKGQDSACNRLEIFGRQTRLPSPTGLFLV